MTTEVVVDTSLALKWVLIEDYSAEARKLLTTWSEAGVRRVAPGWFACEVANAIFQRVRSGQLALPQAQWSLRYVLSLVRMQDIEPTVSIRAVELAWQLGQRASYDAQYLALAEHLDCELWTADQRFWSAASPAFSQVRWVGEISTGAVS